MFNPVTLPSGGDDVYFLGGRDLEMAEIARILRGRGVPFVDRGIDWAHATFSAYEPEIRASIRAGQQPVLVELREIPADALPFVDVIDHHGPESGRLPTSLEQVLTRLGVTALKREQELIVANDKGYIDGMLAIGATPQEIEHVRSEDRKAQGITAEQEIAAEAAIAVIRSPMSGLAIVELPHGKTATVTDRLSSFTGGPGYKNLLVECPNEMSFFGDGRIIQELLRAYGGYCGGNLPDYGYWGTEIRADPARESIRQFVISHFADGIG